MDMRCGGLVCTVPHIITHMGSMCVQALELHSLVVGCLLPARLSGDERGSGRGLHSRPDRASKYKLVPISTLQRTGFTSTAVRHACGRIVRSGILGR